MSSTKAYAAYREDADFLPLSSIGASPDYPAKWAQANATSGIERAKFKVVPVRITIISPKRKPSK